MLGQVSVTEPGYMLVCWISKRVVSFPFRAQTGPCVPMPIPKVSTPLSLLLLP